MKIPEKKFKEIQINKRFLANTGWLLFGSIFKLLLHFVVNILVARYLGPEKLGLVDYISTYTAFFTSLCGLGINGVIIHELVNHREDGRILGTAVVLRLIVGLISSLCMIGIVYCIEDKDPTMTSIAVLQALQLPFAAFDTIKYWYQKKLESKNEVFLTAAAFCVSAIYKISLIVVRAEVVWFALGTTIDVALLGVLFLLSYKKRCTERLCFSRRVAKRIITACGPFLVASLTVFIYSKTDLIMIRHILGSNEKVGLYSVAIAICGYISFVPSAIIDSARPIVMESREKNTSEYQLRIRQLISAVMWIALLYSIVVTLFGPWIIDVLYGEAYAASLGSLRIAVWYTAFSYLGGIKSVWLICENKNKYVTILVAMGAATNIILNVLFIPLWGIEGAAFATLLTQMASNFLYPALFKNTKGFFKCTLDGLFLRWMVVAKK